MDVEKILEKFNIKPTPKMIEGFKNDISDLVELKTLSDEELEILVYNYFSIGESYFFRDENLLEKVVKVCKSYNRPVNVLSVGCSKGEEVYSLAYLFKKNGVKYKIKGIDANSERIKSAKEGVYTFWSVRFLDESKIKEIFDVKEGKFVLKKEYKENVEFEVSKIENYDSNEKFDIILIRRVLIYISNLTLVIEKLKTMLNKDGFIVLGNGEYHRELLEHFEPMDDASAILKITGHPKKHTILKEKTKEIKKDLGRRVNREIQELFRNEIEFVTEKVEILIKENKLEDAYKEVEKALNKNVTCYILWRLKASIEFKMGKIQESLLSTKRALFLNTFDEELLTFKKFLESIIEGG